MARHFLCHISHFVSRTVVNIADPSSVQISEPGNPYSFCLVENPEAGPTEIRQEPAAYTPQVCSMPYIFGSEETKSRSR